MLRKNGFKTVLLAALFILSESVIFAQAWDKEQTKVWNTIESHWQAFANGDVKGFVSNFHQDFTCFANWRTLPINKKILEDWIGYSVANAKIVRYAIEPAQIKVYSDFAVAQYYCDLIMLIGGNKEIRPSFRYTDVLKKEKNGKWLVVAAHKEKGHWQSE